MGEKLSIECAHAYDRLTMYIIMIVVNTAITSRKIAYWFRGRSRIGRIRIRTGIRCGIGCGRGREERDRERDRKCEPELEWSRSQTGAGTGSGAG